MAQSKCAFAIDWEIINCKWQEKNPDIIVNHKISVDYQGEVTWGEVSAVSELLLLGSECSCGRQSGASVGYCTLSCFTVLEKEILLKY